MPFIDFSIDSDAETPGGKILIATNWPARIYLGRNIS